MVDFDPQYEIMLSDMAEWSFWSARLYEGDNSTLEDHYAFYRKWSYSKLESEWEGFFGRDFSNEM
jgi:hypothetical protein